MDQKNEILSPNDREVVEMINQLAVEMMFQQYDNLSPGMKMKLSGVTKFTQKMLDEDFTHK